MTNREYFKDPDDQCRMFLLERKCRRGTYYHYVFGSLDKKVKWLKSKVSSLAKSMPRCPVCGKRRLTFGGGGVLMETNFDRFAHDEHLAQTMFKCHCMCQDCDKCKLRSSEGTNARCLFRWLADKAELTPIKKIRRIGFDYSPFIKAHGRSYQPLISLPDPPNYHDAIPRYKPFEKKIVLRDRVTGVLDFDKDKLKEELPPVFDAHPKPIKVVSSVSLEDAIRKWNALVDKLAAQGVVETVK